MNRQHIEFLKRFDGSVSAQFLVAYLILKKGKTIQMEGIKRAPTADVHEEYRDNGDIFIIDGDSRRKVEVKGISTVFSDDGKFPHPVVIVSSKSSIDGAKEEADWFIIVSGDFKAVGIIHKNTRKYWSVKNILCKRTTGNYDDFYVTTPDKVIWKKIEDF